MGVLSSLGWAAAIGLPPLAYWSVARREQGFAGQHSLTQTGSRQLFDEKLEALGGAVSVRKGVWVDVGFIATLTLPSGVFLWQSEVPALVGFAVLAAVVDLAEGGLLLRALRDRGPRTLRLLKTTSTAKLAGYGVLVLVVLGTFGVALFRNG